MAPKAFVNGGWGISTIFMVISGILSLIACRRLIDVGLALEIYSYSLVVKKVLGSTAEVILEIAISLT